MNEAARIMEEAWDKIKALQESCTHDEITDWFNPHWAPGHSSPYEIIVCKRCDKELKRRNYRLVDPNSEGTQ